MSSVNCDRLVAELRATIRGEVRFDNSSRALYSTDASNYRQIPIGVVIPRDVEEVEQAVAVCRRQGVPVLPRGGGTSLAGQCCNVAVVIDMSKHLNRIMEINSEIGLARVEPGVILDRLRDAAEPHRLTFGPDPSTHNWCTLGGMIGNNSCGVHSVMAGNTVDNVEELEILTFDGVRLRVGKTTDHELEVIINEGGRRGEIYGELKSLRDRYESLIRKRYPKIPRRVSGYNLDQLLPENEFNVARALVGTEGTCVFVLGATVRLVHSPPARSLLVIGYPDVYAAADDVVAILAHRPLGLEGMDDRLIAYIRSKGLLADEVALLPPGRGWLLVEFGGEAMADALDQVYGLMRQLASREHSPSVRLFDEPKQAANIWRLRESALGAQMRVPGQKDNWEGWEDCAVSPEKLGDYLRDFNKLVKKYGYNCAFYGHFGQGCVHNRLDFDFRTPTGLSQFVSFINEGADLVVRYGGSLSGEHGDGQARASLLPKMFGEELVQAFREFKAIWDPEGRMNPGKVVDPYPVHENLRHGPAYKPWQPATHFKFPDDHGSFADATLRCVGVGKCRKEGQGTMCPSYMVTREEKHSTRGRARLLFEMFEGEVITGGWRDENVREALDLCLACKGCKSDCPAKVDLATYKAEFLSHYYKRRLRPITAYTMGLIPWWSRLASHAPSLVNLFTQTPLVRDVTKAVAGVAPERQIPTFAAETFKEWFRRRRPQNEGKPKVILWPDTFNNHFHPEVAKAAVEVLEATGYQVGVPEQALCCGRPLYDWGMLKLAKRSLRQILETLRLQIADGTPIVGLEPSCVAVFRDELINLFPNDENAKRLSRQMLLFSEFLERRIDDFRFPKMNRKAVVHAHCHQTAIMGMAEERALLLGLGLDFELLDSGCCGMAGAFGFEKKHYDVSTKVGEKVLLPAIRNTAKDTLIIANGFSCSEQIRQETSRRALHVAEVIHMAMHEGNS